MAKRLAAPDIVETLASDHRAPVFYLREFAQEDRPFTTISYDECERLDVPMLNAQAFRHPATFEQYFDFDIRQKIGPFVALGNPYDYAPPGGASREYLADDQWMDAFRDLAKRSSLIVMHTGGSANLQRELTMLGEMELTQKLFVFTKPKAKRRVLLESRVVASENKKWQEFANLFSKSELTPCEYPGLGAVLTFQDDAAVVIVRGCTAPEQYVSAIESRLDAGKRCDPVLTNGNARAPHN
jgi:hypothetical protein